MSVLSPSDPYHALLNRLCAHSVTKHYDAYADIDWDSEAFRIDPADPRWELTPEDGLGRTEWYRSQPQAARARLGLGLVVELMQLGVHFENILTQGLLRFTTTIDRRSPEFRYAYHEIIEESQHSLMFQEFVKRSGVPAPELAGRADKAAERIAPLGSRAPEAFFLFVLAGETLLDTRQRDELHRKAEPHPLLRRIIDIHVTEEARHLSFARAYLRHHVPHLPERRRVQLVVAAPRILRRMRARLHQPSPTLCRQFGIPEHVARCAREHPAEVVASNAHAAPLVALCGELGVWSSAWSAVEGRLARLLPDA